MANKYFLPLLILLSGVFWSCQNRSVPEVIHGPEAYEAFFRHPESGLLAVREHQDIRFAAQYLPPDWQNWKRYQQGGFLEPQENTHPVVFVLNIGAAEGARTGDVMTYGVSNLEGYAQRMETMNFRLEDAIELRVGEHKIRPKLVHMENTYGLTQDRNIHLVFEDSSLDSPREMTGDLDLVFDDPVYGTGINHFRISREALNTLPRLEI